MTQTKWPPGNPGRFNNPNGDIVNYAAAFQTDNEALEATMSNVPAGWMVTAVLGEMSDDEIVRLGLQSGDVRQLP